MLILIISPMNKILSACNVLSIFLLIVITILSVMIYISNDVIPTHWALNGHIDSYGKSYSVFLDLFITMIMCFLLLFFEKHPHLCNLPWTFSKYKDCALLFVQLNLSIINLLVMIYQSYIFIATYNNMNLNIVFFAVILSIGIFTTIYCIKNISILHKKEIEKF